MAPWHRLAPSAASPALHAPLPPGAAGAWCLVRLRGVAPPARLLLHDERRGHLARTVWASPHGTLLHVPGEARVLSVLPFGALGVRPEVLVRPLSRAAAALRLLPAAATALPPALLGPPLGLSGRLRAVLGRAGRSAPPPYAEWIRRFDRTGAATPPPGPPLRVVLPSGPPGLLRATLLSLEAQRHPAMATAVLPLPALRQAVLAAARAAPDGHVLLLEPGEVLPPHALLAFATLLAALPPALRPDVAYADHDRLGPAGREAPAFLPGGGPLLLRSGLPARGPCLLRAAALLALPPSPDPTSGTLRQVLVAALAPSGRIRHLPLVLCQRHADAPEPPPLPAPAPLRGVPPPVSVLVPSAARSGHVLRCLRALLRRTEGVPLEILLAVSAVHPRDRRQARLLSHLRALPGLRVLPLDLPRFNYARVNNLAAAEARHEHLLLLNDDVEPLRPDWLARMSAHLADPAVGAVGARLLYGHGAVQHAGVILGLGGLAEHADRLSAPREAGPLGLVDREVSAVTAACLLARRADWMALGGMDERFAVALNDVDLCLRLRAMGRGIVQCNAALLRHHESLSLGRHYAGARADLEAREVGLLRARWGGALAADPFHSPALSLDTGAEWTPAWPPRPAGEPGVSPS